MQNDQPKHEQQDQASGAARPDAAAPQDRRDAQS